MGKGPGMGNSIVYEGELYKTRGAQIIKKR